MTKKVYVFQNASALQHAVANAWVTIAKQSITQRGQFHIALSGGSTPKALFKLMATSEYSDQLDWQHCHIYFGDERYVPHDHADSNYKMARQSMIDDLPIPESNVHPVQTDINDVDACAADYELLLRNNLPLANGTDNNEVPVFDLMLQGVGDDGHTASLFPGTPALYEQDKKVTAVYVEKFDSWRISVTFSVINHARHIIVLAAGEGKKSILHELFMGPVTKDPYPVQMLDPSGEYVWYVDEAAAQGIAGDFIVRA